MCGIVGAVAQRNVLPILMDGLSRLEYRGYDSAGVAVVDTGNKIQRSRVSGKVSELSQQLEKHPLSGQTGIAHTRWATHGKPTVINAHPHVCRDEHALVHNGIIENYRNLQQDLSDSGYELETETDSEVIVALINRFQGRDMDILSAVMNTVKLLEGSYAFAVISANEPGNIIVARKGSPLVIGIGKGENFIASDVLALLPVTRQFIFLEDGDIASIKTDSMEIYDVSGSKVHRQVSISSTSHDISDKSGFRHYMLKEIFEQPRAINDLLTGRINDDKVIESEFGQGAKDVFDTVKAIKIVACGTSYHAGLIAHYWAEDIAGIPCSVEIASEYRYRKIKVLPGTLFVTISQSGETADTLAALQLAKTLGYAGTLAICNVPESSLTRESDFVFMTRAGVEIGVASTKAFTTQLVALMMLVLVLGRRYGLDSETEKDIVNHLRVLPGRINTVLEMNGEISKLARYFINKHHVLYLGRGTMLPVAMEGALKLKEISYIHAEAYAAGELKHGPLALVDEDMPVITVLSNNELLEKIKSNMQEVRARGGKLFVFTDAGSGIEEDEDVQVLTIVSVNDYIAPVLYTVPLQLLAYHIAVYKGADIDQPRNLAKSVTVE